MNYCPFLLLLLMPLSSFSQNQIAVEGQLYPAGNIVGFRLDLSIAEHSFISTRLALNTTDRKDWGKHEQESGEGTGVGIGIHRSRMMNTPLTVFFRTDLWFMNIDWEDPYVGPALCGALPCPPLTGRSEITILQPTVGLELPLKLSPSIYLSPSLSIGYEINIHTKGEEVGEGAILLAGLRLAYRL